MQTCRTLGQMSRSSSPCRQSIPVMARIGSDRRLPPPRRSGDTRLLMSILAAWSPRGSRQTSRRSPALLTRCVRHVANRVLEGDGPFWDGQIGPAGKDPLSRHILDCRMSENGGMGFTHPLPSGSYVFSSISPFSMVAFGERLCHSRSSSVTHEDRPGVLDHLGCRC